MNGSFTIDYFRNWYDYNISFGFELLESHIKEIEELIKIGIENYENNVQTEEITYDDFHSTVVEHYLGIDSGMYFLDEIFKDYFPNLKRQSIFLMICSFRENKLYKLCFEVQKEEQSIISVDEMYSRSGKLDRIRFYFKKSFIKQYNKQFELQWKIFHNYYRIRNQLSHNFGKIDLSKNQKLKEFILNKSLITINSDNELVIDKGFLEQMINDLRELSKTIQELIRNYYNKNYNLN